MTDNEQELRKGDRVSVLCSVEYDAPPGDNYVTVARQSKMGDRVRFDISRDQIDRIHPKPIPDEPDHNSILADRKGNLWTRSKNGWRMLTGSSVARDGSWPWTRGFLDDFGPFEVFSSNHTVGLD